MSKKDKKTQEKPQIDENILFLNKTKLKEEDITAFQTFAVKKHSLFIAIAITVVFGGLGIGLCFVNTYIGVAILLAGIIGGLFFFPYLSKNQIKTQNAAIFGGKDYANTFEFYSDHLKVINIDEAEPEKEINADDAQSRKEISQEFSYDELYKLVTFKNYVCLYINKNQSFLLSYIGMKKGTIAELIDFLKAKNLAFQDKTALGEMKKK